MKQFMTIILLIILLFCQKIIAQPVWNFFEDTNVVRVEEIHFSDNTLYCRAYYDGYSKYQKNDYFICKLVDGKFVALCGINSDFPSKIDKKVLFSPKRFAVTSDGSIYTIFDNSVYLYKNSKWSLFYQDTVLNDTLLDLRTIHRDCFDNIWLIQEKKIIYQQAPNLIYWGVGGRLIKIKNGIISYAIDTVYNNTTINNDFNLASGFLLTSDSLGNIISSETNYLFMFNQFDNTIRTYHNATLYNSLLRQPLNLYVDKWNRIWIIFKNNSRCSGGLISIFDKGNWSFISSEQGLSDSLSTSSFGYSTDILCSSDNSIWTTSNWGALHIKNNTAELIYPKNILPDNYPNAEFNPNISCIAQADNGDIYLGAYPGLFKYTSATNIIENPSQNIIISPNPASDYITLTIPPLEKRGLGGVLPEICIFDIFGKPVLNVGAIHELPLRIDIYTLPAGMYFIRIGDKIKKFIKI